MLEVHQNSIKMLGHINIMLSNGMELIQHVGVVQQNLLLMISNLIIELSCPKDCFQHVGV